MKKPKIIVVGGGPAGLMAAGQAASAGADTVLFEKMKRPAMKLCITGKGRCNLTNVAGISDFIDHFGETGPFLRAVFDLFFTDQLAAFFEGLGVDLVTERGGRVFPESGRAPEVADALLEWAKSSGVRVQACSPVGELILNNGRVTGIVSNGKKIHADAVVLATGGASYQRTGSTGDGYRIAESSGHAVVPHRPALVPLETEGDGASRLVGLELRNVRAALLIDGQRKAEEFGDLVFTHTGVTGPTILTLSGQAVDALLQDRQVALSIDLKPALSHEKLEARLIRDLKERADEQLGAVLRGLLPREMVPFCVEMTKIQASRKAGSVSADERKVLLAWLKDVRLEIVGSRPIEEAIVTAGGIDTSEIDPQTMESLKVKGLYFAGELLDIQADTGGYNLQAAFSTGWLAGRSAAGLDPVPVANVGQGAEDAGRKEGRSRGKQKTSFLPTTKAEMKDRGWDSLDVVLVSGDSYIDSPFIGVAVIGKVLLDAGYRVGVIAQPDVTSGDDITRLGEPELFWGITAGCIDSMVANYTGSGKKRRNDDYTPGGTNDRRPDRASIVYSNLVRKHFKNTRPIVLGGIEASLRRVAHYDFWTNKIRRSILFDAKADYLLYGMAERSVLELVSCLKEKSDPRRVRGLCYISRERPEESMELPSYKDVAEDKDAFTRMFRLFYENNDPVTANTIAQLTDTRYLVQNPPAPYLSAEELDALHELDYERDLHPYYLRGGDVKALETIRFAIATHRGCYGECNFCAIAVHQGRTVRWRSEKSIIREAKQLVGHPQFKGRIHDVGGPTANMYGFECRKKVKAGCCSDKRCVYPEVCDGLKVDHSRLMSLLKALRGIKGVKQVVVASGIRHDMVISDERNGMAYLREVIAHHVSGQLKIAPEHSQDSVLKMMGKPGRKDLLEFRDLFFRITREAGKDQYLTYYMIAAHPGCRMSDMSKLRDFSVKELKVRPEQVQVFTPTPSTYSTLMYWTERDPFSGNPCFVEKGERGREQQRHALTVGINKRR